MSWAKLGAMVTGVDLSTEAIKQANKLKLALGLEANFVANDICQLVVKIQRNSILYLLRMVFFAGYQILIDGQKRS
ncbi:MAG: class I SAM-dependent methyltransferase [Alcanivoracaceae bacterium]|nr:class I SAM-dependent methyltransferase [Alcanivoracaceae bacterium]